MSNAQEHLKALSDLLANLGPVAVAVSGGVDSMTLAYVAHQVNPASQMFHAISPAVPTQATDRVQRYAEREGWRLNLIDAREIHDADYLNNPVNRCYFCKTNLYDTVAQNTTLTVVSGTNQDDLGDYRPGLIAAAEHAVVHPYVEAGITKQMLRDIAKLLGLDDLSELPAAPCLSSRVTTGIRIDPSVLPLINDAEQALWVALAPHLDLKGVRCRIRPDVLAIEIETESTIDQHAEYARAARDQVSSIFLRGGQPQYAHQVVIEPYRRGSAFLIETLEVR